MVGGRIAHGGLLLGFPVVILRLGWRGRQARARWALRAADAVVTAFEELELIDDDLECGKTAPLVSDMGLPFVAISFVEQNGQWLISDIQATSP